MNKFSSKIIRYSLILLFTGLLAGTSACSSHRKAQSVPDSTANSRRVKVKSATEAEALAHTYENWETFYAPFTLRVTRPAAMSVSGRASMVRDSYIHLSMRMLGFEVAVAYIDRDSVYLADKYHKILVTEPVEALTDRTGLTIGDIQDVLMGRAFYPGEGTLCLLELPQIKFAANHEEELTRLTPRGLPDFFVPWYFSLDDTPVVRRLTVTPPEREPFIVMFDDVKETPAGNVASEVMLVGEAAGKQLEAAYQWNLSKAKWNEKLNEPSKEFKGYRRISLSELFEALKQH